MKESAIEDVAHELADAADAVKVAQQRLAVAISRFTALRKTLDEALDAYVGMGRRP